MEFITGFLVELLVDPVLIVATIVLAVVLVSGLPGRLIEAWDDRALTH